MLIFGKYFQTQSDQNIHQNAPNGIIFSKFSRIEYGHYPLNHIGVQLYYNYFYMKIAFFSKI